MERRKIILFGKTAFCVTLPQSWVKKNKLQKGDTLGVQETPRNSLELVPEQSTKEEAMAIDYQVEDKSIEDILSFLRATYLNGYSSITLSGSNAGKISGVREYIHELIATEVMEVSSNKIVINMLWDVATMDLPTMISRIDNIIKTLFMETAEVFAGLRTDDEDIVEKGHEVQRQVLLTRRMITHAIHHSSTAQRFNLSTLEIYYLSYLVYFLGRIGEYLVEMATSFRGFAESEELTPQIRDMTGRLLKGLSSNYDSSMEAYYKQSKGAPFTIERYEEYDQQLEALLGLRAPVALAEADSIKRLMTKVEELESTVMNMHTAPK